jgi:hypothetical protein
VNTNTSVVGKAEALKLVNNAGFGFITDAFVLDVSSVDSILSTFEHDGPLLKSSLLLTLTSTRCHNEKFLFPIYIYIGC